MLTCWLDDGGNQVCADLQRYDADGNPVGRAPGSDPGAEAMQAAHPAATIYALGPDASGTPAYAAYDTSTGTGAGSLAIPDLTAGLSEAEAWRRIREINPTFIEHDLPILLTNAPPGSVSGLGLLNSYLITNNPAYIAAGLPMPWNLLDNSQAALLHAGSSWWEKFSGRTVVPVTRYGMMIAGLAVGYQAGHGDLGSIADESGGLSGSAGNDTLAGGSSTDTLSAGDVGSLPVDPAANAGADVPYLTDATGATAVPVGVDGLPSGGGLTPSQLVDFLGTEALTVPIYTPAQSGDLMHYQQPATGGAESGAATGGDLATVAQAGKAGLGLAGLVRGLFGGDPPLTRPAAGRAALVPSPTGRASGGSLGSIRQAAGHGMVSVTGDAEDLSETDADGATLAPLALAAAAAGLVLLTSR